MNDETPSPAETVASTPPETSADAPTVDAAAKPSPLRILLVEDTQTDALLIRRALERSGSDALLTVVPRAEDALDLLERHVGAFDVMVTDHRLPGMHGLELCTEVLRQKYPVGSVLLTGAGSEDLAVQALKAGVDEYLIKDTRGGYLALFRTLIEGVAQRQKQRDEHRRAEEKARHLAAIVESSHDAIIGCDLEQAITSWNPAAERIFGHDARDAIGQPLSILLPEDHGDEMPRIMGRILAGERIAHYETIRRRRDGSTVEVSLTVSPIRAAGGTVVGSSVIVRDITDQRRVEADRRRAHHDMETFLYGVTHDLKAPLLSIRGMTGLIREELGDEPGEELETYFSHLDGAAERMTRLLGDLDKMAQVGRSNTAVAAVELGAVTRRVIDDLSRHHADRSIRADVPDDLPVVWANSERLRQILEGLIDNAIKFSSPGAPVELEIGVVDDGPRPESGQQVICYVRDHGPGIPRGEQRRIFEMFYRRQGREEKGTGMGLAFVKKLVELLGGAIWVESRVGRGSTFYFTLPRHRSPGPSPQPPPVGPPATPPVALPVTLPATPPGAPSDARRPRLDAADLASNPEPDTERLPSPVDEQGTAAIRHLQVPDDRR